ncbi:MAG: hypothetical protein WCB85_01310 [Candidatus Dormiibacterota bacterium]
MSAEVAPAAGLMQGERVGLWARFRRDQPWWLLPLTVVVVLGAFTGYTLWTMFFGPGPNHVSQAGPYLSPFFSPLLWKTGPVTPAIWVLWAPLSFRFTCYYYRKAYYRSFLWDPPACAVGELRHRRYRGESRLPMALNNLHRFTWFPSAIVVVFLWIDAVASLDYQGHLYLGVGTLILFVNCALLSGYSGGCHAFRHMAGGGLDCFSCMRGGRARFQLWRGVSVLNMRHATWAWVSMFSVILAEVYVRLLQAGMPDPHHLF